MGLILRQSYPAGARQHFLCLIGPPQSDSQLTSGSSASTRGQRGAQLSFLVHTSNPLKCSKMSIEACSHGTSSWRGYFRASRFKTEAFCVVQRTGHRSNRRETGTGNFYQKGLIMATFQGGHPTVHAAIHASFCRTLFAEVGTLPPLIPKDELRAQNPHFPLLLLPRQTMATTSDTAASSDESQSQYAKRTQDLIGLITDLRALGCAVIVCILSMFAMS